LELIGHFFHQTQFEGKLLFQLLLDFIISAKSFGDNQLSSSGVGQE
jgi:hypothetical protein